jgi:hypothetical protein
MTMISILAIAGSPAPSSQVAARTPDPTVAEAATADGAPDEAFATALDRARESSTAATARTGRATGRQRREIVASGNRTIGRRRTTDTAPVAGGLTTPALQPPSEAADETPTRDAVAARGRKVSTATAQVAADGTASTAGPLDADSTTTPAAASRGGSAASDPVVTAPVASDVASAVDEPTSEPAGATGAAVQTTDQDPTARPQATAPTGVASDGGAPRALDDGTTSATRATRATSASRGDGPSTPSDMASAAATTAAPTGRRARAIGLPAATAPLAGATPQSPAGLETPAATAQAIPATPTDLHTASATGQAGPAIVAMPAASTPGAPAPADPDAGKARTRAGATSTPPTPITARPTAGGDSSASASGGQTAAGGQNGGGETLGPRDVGRRAGASEAASPDSSPDPVANSDASSTASSPVISSDSASIAAASQSATIHGTSGTVAGAADVSTAASADPANADRLLDQVIGQIRLHGGNVVPSLETRLHDPQLGSLRLVLLGRAGETIHAELIAADPATADAISRAADRAIAGSLSLAGIDLRIRSEGGSFQASGGNHGRPDEAAAGFSGDDNRNNAAGTFRNGAGDDGGSDRSSTTTSDSARLAARLAPAIARSTPANVRTRSAGLDVWA